MSAWAKPGVKCVCVDDAFHMSSGVLPVAGNVYTISWIGHWKWFDNQGVGVHLAEISRTPDSVGVIHPFGLRRFRPLITNTQEQDVAKFRHLLTPIDAGLVPAGVELDA